MIFWSISLRVVVCKLPFLKSIDRITVLKKDAVSFNPSFQANGSGMSLHHHMLRLDIDGRLWSNNVYTFKLSTVPILTYEVKSGTAHKMIYKRTSYFSYKTL